MTTTARVRPGVPTGGQFAATDHAEADIDLGAAIAEPQRTSFAEFDRDTRIEAMRSEIDDAMANLSNADGWREFLDSQSRFHQYSLGNQLLIACQKPDATIVAGFNSWKNDHGRTVKKGEKGIWVNAPVTRRLKEKDPVTGQEAGTVVMVGVRAVAVFDVSQTEGKDLPESPAIARESLDGEAPAEMVEAMDKFFADQGFAVSYEPLGEGEGAPGGYTSFGTKRVAINSDRGPREQARVKAHEAGHIALGHDESMADYHSGAGGKRPDMEVEAESVAYVVGRHFGLDEIGGASFNYVDGWARGNPELVKKTATRVCAASKKLLPPPLAKPAKAAA